MKKKLLILLGAGSSIEQDFPSVQILDGEIAALAQDRAAKLGNQDFYGQLWKNRAAYHSDLNDEVKRLQEWRTLPNYERVLGDLQVLMNAAFEKPFGDPVLQWLSKSDIGIEPVDKKNGLVLQIEGQLSALLDKVAERIRGQSNLFRLELQNGRGALAFEPYRKLFDGLAAEFDLGVYNLNYDNVALHALPKAFVGFDRQSGDFIAKEVLSRQGWNFIYHLHGSVHHRIRDDVRIMEDKNFGPRIDWYDDLSQTGDTEDWRNVWNPTIQSDQKRVMLSSVVAGGSKLDQLQTEPFLTLYSSLQRHVYEADAILIGGYGFGDSHIDATLRNMIRSRANGTARPPVMVLDWEENGKTIAQRVDHWAFAMAQVLRVPKATFRDPQHRSVTHWTEVPHVVTPGEFEQALGHSVAVWNGGFCAAASKVDQITRWLAGN